MEEEKKPQGIRAGSSEDWYAIFSYLSFLCFVPIIMKKDSDFVKFHVRQGIVLFVAELGICVIGIVPILGQVVYMLGMIAAALLSLMGIVHVLLGDKWKMPVVGEWAERIKIF